MAERPILFSAPMVRAILAGQKTQTRRVVKGTALEWLAPGMFTPEFTADSENHLCPYGVPGDRLWVRETWAQNWNQLSDTRMDRSYVYRADGEVRAQDNGTDLPWRPSIHMPRAASRITLEITGVRVERLQAISEADAMAEGAEPILVPPDGGSAPHAEGFRELWSSINGRESWDANPWVWVVSFRRLEAAC